MAHNRVAAVKLELHSVDASLEIIFLAAPASCSQTHLTKFICSTDRHSIFLLEITKYLNQISHRNSTRIDGALIVTAVSALLRLSLLN